MRKSRLVSGAGVMCALMLILGGCGASSAGSPAPPSTSGPPATGQGTLVLVKGDNIWTMGADGSNAVQLTHESNSNFDNNPVFSPDGSLIAYSRHVAPVGNSWGGAELHVMKADGTDDRLLMPAKGKGERSENPAWLPDGKAILFSHDLPIIDQSNNYTGDKLSLDRVDLQTGAVSPLIQNGMFPSTAPAANLLVWELYDPATSKFQLQVGGLDGSSPKTLVSDKDFQAVLNPHLSPNGKEIVFAGSGRTSSKVEAAGKAAAALNPFAPEVASAHGLPWDPWIIGVDGSGLRKVVNIGSDEQALAWSPDGQIIAFANLSATFLVRPDGGGLNRLLTHGDPGGLDWKVG